MLWHGITSTPEISGRSDPARSPRFRLLTRVPVSVNILTTIVATMCERDECLLLLVALTCQGERSASIERTAVVCTPPGART